MIDDLLGLDGNGNDDSFDLEIHGGASSHTYTIATSDDSKDPPHTSTGDSDDGDPIAYHNSSESEQLTVHTSDTSQQTDSVTHRTEMIDSEPASNDDVLLA